jgi:hypothetical protein
MKTYYFRIYQCGDEDGDNIWVKANSEEEARAQVYHDYHSIDDLLLMGVGNA